jgi:Uma2 family endonuclease
VGVPFYWLLDPIARTLEVQSLQDGYWLQVAVFSDDDRVAAVPFDTVPFELADLWPLDLDIDPN